MKYSVIMLALLSICVQINSAEESVTVQLESLLGYSKSGTVSERTLVEMLLQKNEIAKIRLKNIKSITKLGGRHELRTAWGEIFVGKLPGSITLKSGGDDKEYSLNSVKNLIIDVPDLDPKRYSQYIKNYVWWRITGLKAKEFAGKPLKEISFSGEYYSTAGYIMGGSNNPADIKSPRMKMGEDTVLINLDDFERFEISKYNRNWSITVKANDSNPVKGLLVLEAKDSKGTHTIWDWQISACDYNEVRYNFIENKLIFEKIPGADVLPSP